MALRDYLAEEIATDYGDSLLTRREAVRRLGLIGLGTSAAVALLAACGGGGDEKSKSASRSTRAPATPPAVESVRFQGPRGELQGAWAAARSPRGTVLVIHENRGLTDHIRSLPPRFAGDGYSALAIDLLSEEGGTAAVGARPRPSRRSARLRPTVSSPTCAPASTSSSGGSHRRRLRSWDSASAAG
jgi:carboxymethylenebutenolidase